jgi:hypothetical protein
LLDILAAYDVAFCIIVSFSLIIQLTKLSTWQGPQIVGIVNQANSPKEVLHSARIAIQMDAQMATGEKHVNGDWIVMLNALLETVFFPLLSSLHSSSFFLHHLFRKSTINMKEKMPKDFVAKSVWVLLE